MGIKKQKLSQNVGRRIRDIRESKNLKQCELAELLDMEPSNLCKLENGKQLPKEENYEKLAVALGVEIKDFFDFSHQKSKGILVEELKKIIDNSSIEDLEFYFRIISFYKQRIK